MDKYKQVMDSAVSGGVRPGTMTPRAMQAINGSAMDAGGDSSAGAFLIGELEKQDPRLLEPMTSITAPRDIDMIPGGGWVDVTSNVFVNYATSGNDEDAIAGGQSNNIPTSQANISKDVFKMATFHEVLKLPMLDDIKMRQIGRSLSQILDQGLRLNYSKMIDRNVYVGISKMGTPGLVNNPNVTSALVANNTAGTSRLWINKTPTEIMTDVNQMLVQGVTNSEYDLSGMPNRILVDWENFSYINNTPVSSAGTQSILKYLLENNIATSQGRELQILPLRWCKGAGVGGVQRMVAYVKSDDRLNMDMSVPLTRMMTDAVVSSASFESLFMAQFSQVKFLAMTTVYYADGI